MHPPKIFVSYAHDNDEHFRQVRVFATFLRSRIGLDVHLDQWDDGRRMDWAEWAEWQLESADFVLVIASPEYKRRVEGHAPPDEGRGSRYEARLMRDQLTRDLDAQTQRLLPVVLPGGAVEDLPSFLTPYSTTRYEIGAITEKGVAGVLAAITGQSENPRPERGIWRGGAEPAADEPVLVAGLAWRAKSADVSPGPAQIGGILYEQSVRLRTAGPATGDWAFAELELGGAYTRFTAVAGVLDDAADVQFQTGLFRVLLDGEVRRQDRSAYGRPRPVDLDVTGVRRLRLELCRPAAGSSPFGLTARRTRPAALAWGDPTLH